MQELINEATKTNAVPINRTVYISIIFTLITQTATNRTHGIKSNQNQSLWIFTVSLQSHRKNPNAVDMYIKQVVFAALRNCKQIGKMREDPGLAGL